MADAESSEINTARGKVSLVTFLGSGALTSTAYWTQNVGQTWIVLHMGGTAADLGALAAFQYGPYVLFGFHGAAIAEVLNKKYMLQTCQLVLSALALCLAFLQYYELLTISSLFGTAVVASIINCFGKPARQAFTAGLFKGGGLTRAIGFNAAINYATRIAVPAIAGIMISYSPLYFFFMFCSGCYAASVVFVGFAKAESQNSRQLYLAKSVDHAALAGLNYIYRSPTLRRTAANLVVMTVLPFSFNVFIPVLAKEHFNLSATGYGTMLSVMAVGSVIGAIFSSRLREYRRAAVVLSLIIIAISEIALAFPIWIIVSYLLLFLCGASIALFLTSSNTEFLKDTPTEMRARVAGMYDYVASGIGPLGSAFVGILISTWGIRVTLLFCALCALSVAISEIRAGSRG
ncbi:MFS transporter [Rhizobium leguminosarum]|uniref:MFS transporter n=1 Tax=Rhizobium leguminosarum TaxID=384 RepID=UPI001C97C085|nr:MFS transporter [Rhizobium leguminosarum]MBY5637697.1 MFS transporter [Rhizobium leguminosarum]